MWTVTSTSEESFKFKDGDSEMYFELHSHIAEGRGQQLEIKAFCPAGDRPPYTHYISGRDLEALVEWFRDQFPMNITIKADEGMNMQDNVGG